MKRDSILQKIFDLNKYSSTEKKPSDKTRMEIYDEIVDGFNGREFPALKHECEMLDLIDLLADTLKCWSNDMEWKGKSIIVLSKYNKFKEKYYADHDKKTEQES